MKHVFADTCFWIAITDPMDGLHGAAIQARAAIGKAVIHTTDEVLGEYLNHLSRWGPEFRALAVQVVKSIHANTNSRVHRQTPDSFNQGFTLYQERPDKEWSLVDCIAINTMTAHGITEALTNDHHFEQAGFAILIRDA